MGFFSLFGKPNHAGEWFGKSDSEKERIVDKVTRDYITESMKQLRKLNGDLQANANILSQDDASSAIEQRLTSMHENGETIQLVKYISDAYRKQRADIPYLNLALRVVSTYFKELEKLKMQGKW
jgi:hypothetical protein